LVHGVGGTGAPVFVHGVGGTGAPVLIAIHGVGGTGAPVLAQGVGGTGAPVFAHGVGGTGAPVFAIVSDFALIAPQSTNIAIKTTDFFDMRLLRGKLRAESISKIEMPSREVSKGHIHPSVTGLASTFSVVEEKSRVPNWDGQCNQSTIRRAVSFLRKGPFLGPFRHISPNRASADTLVLDTRAFRP
jgi:hypothetical protein